MATASGSMFQGLEVPDTGNRKLESLLHHWSGGCATLVRLRLGGRNSLTRIAHLKARKAPHADILTELANLRRDELRNRHGRVLDERLLQQANLLVELFHHASDHFLGNMLWLARGDDWQAR